MWNDLLTFAAWSVTADGGPPPLALVLVVLSPLVAHLTLES